MQVQTVWESDSLSSWNPRKLEITKFWRDLFAPNSPGFSLESQKRKKIFLWSTHRSLSIWQLQNSSFPDQGENWCSPEDTRRRSILVALPNSSPIKRFYQKTNPVVHETSTRYQVREVIENKGILPRTYPTIPTYLGHFTSQTWICLLYTSPSPRD